jgi:hypothetical protein
MPAEYQQSGSAAGSVPFGSAMYWTVEYVKERPFVRVVAAGIYDIDAHMRMLEDVVAREFWKPGMNLLVDDSELDFSRTSLEQLREAGQKRIEFDALIGNGKTAVLVNSLVNFGRARQFELITTGKVSAKIDVFKTEAEAVRWLLA